MRGGGPKLHKSYKVLVKSLLGWRCSLILFIGELVSSEIIDIYQDQRVNWPTSITMILFHVGAIAALFMFSWPVFLATVFLYWVTVGLGISMGYHRLHTHRSYKLPLWIERTFALFGSMTLEGGPIFCFATHRIHHQHSDMPADPDSPRDCTQLPHAARLLTG